MRARPLDQLAEGPIFVVGMARSGTTWVYDILTAHPEVGGALETWMFTRRDGLAPLFSAAHWPPAERPPVGLSRVMTRDQFIDDIRGLASTWLARRLESEHRFVVEKSPNHAAVMPLIAEVFPDARFIHVLRDGRDVAVSVDAAASSWAPLWRSGFGKSFTTVASTWRRTVRAARASGAQLEGRFLEVRYEDIKQDPVGTYRILFSFCRIPCTEEFLQEVLDATDFKRRFRGGEDRFRRAGEIGQWRTRFTRRQAALFDMVAGDTLIDTGYERTRGWWVLPFSGLPAIGDRATTRRSRS